MENRISAIIPDNEYWKKQVKCQYSCPVKTDARGYVNAISEGRYEDAYRIARGPNPFASICGRVCGAPCEGGCRRGNIDEPVSIRALKRFVTEMHGVEAIHQVQGADFSTARRDERNPKAGTKIAVIGAGVAGLSAAHDLALLGYNVTVFESGPVAGGMLVSGVPMYRLPRKLVKQEIDSILRLGVTLKLNTTVGKDVSIQELRSGGYEAVLIAAGLQKSRKVPIEGGEYEGVLHGIEFLKKLNLGEPINIGEKVVVIGGGNVAFDVARTAIRAGAFGQKHMIRDFYEAADTARTALRAGSREVHLVCLESVEEMPADELEILEGVEEGVVLHASRGPLRVAGKNGKVTGLETRVVKSVFDANGRFNPEYDERPGEVIEADTVIFAIGQAADINFLNDLPGVNLTRSSLIDVDGATMKTGIPWLFACGDIAQGAGLFIDAIASGRKAAASMDAYIRGGGTAREESLEFEIIEHRMPAGYLQKERVNPRVIGAHKRASTMDYIEINYDEKTARDQGDRCLRCNVNTIFNGNLCILCGGCVDVCPVNCLQLVKLSDLDATPGVELLVNRSFGIDMKKIMEEGGAAAVDAIGSVMIKNEELCVRCGFCAKRCPAGAVTMEKFSYREKECCGV